MTSTRTYRTTDVPVDGGSLRVGIFEPEGVTADTPSVLVIHGITASHLAWLFLAEELQNVRIIAPDLRGRAASRAVNGPAGMRTHAADLVQVLDAFEIDKIPVIGHSMGGFVGLVLAHTAPERVSSLMLVDGGLPLAAPEGVSPEELVQAILGPTAARLSMTFPTEEAYLDFWRQHPAFQDWNVTLEQYFRYDLCDTGDGFVPSTSLATTTEDTIDLNTGTAITDALSWLKDSRLQVTFLTVPRGLQNEVPGLYPPEHLEELLAQYPQIEHHHVEGFNHYTIVMSEAGSRVITEILAGAR